MTSLENSADSITILSLTQGMELFDTGCRNFDSISNPIMGITRSSSGKRSHHNISDYMKPILDEINNVKGLDDGFHDDLLNDAFTLTSKHGMISSNKESSYYYPHSEAFSSSLINLSKESRRYVSKSLILIHI